MFQTASLYSIEVDYFNYGTCEITKGSYFCGDHSCNTFKHVGAHDRVNSAQVVSEHRIIGSTGPLAWSHQGSGGQPKNRPWGASTDPIYTSGSGNTQGNPGNNPTLISDAYVQADMHGYPLRADAVGPQYHLYDGMKLPHQALIGLVPGYGYGTPADTYEKKQHAKETLVAGRCKAICDVDDTCKAYQENRWEALHTTIKCVTFHFSMWPKDVAGLLPVPNLPTAGGVTGGALVADEGWDFFEKYTLGKSPTWLHAPVTTAFQPTTHGRRLDGVY